MVNVFGYFQLTRTLLRHTIPLLNVYRSELHNTYGTMVSNCEILMMTKLIEEKHFLFSPFEMVE